MEEEVSWTSEGDTLVKLKHSHSCKVSLKKRVSESKDYDFGTNQNSPFRGMSSRFCFIVLLLLCIFWDGDSAVFTPPFVSVVFSDSAKLFSSSARPSEMTEDTEVLNLWSASDINKSHLLLLG